MSATKLFSDSEVFQKERPLQATEEQLEEWYLDTAKEMQENGYSSSSVEVIISDLKKLDIDSDSGFEMAKELEGYRMNGSYEIDSQFIEYLEGLNDSFNDVNKENVRAWVKAHDIRPKFFKGFQIEIVNKFHIGLSYKPGDILFINGFCADTAEYYIHHEKKNGGLCNSLRISRK